MFWIFLCIYLFIYLSEFQRWSQTFQQDPNMTYLFLCPFFSWLLLLLLERLIDYHFVVIHYVAMVLVADFLEILIFDSHFFFWFEKESRIHKIPYLILNKNSQYNCMKTYEIWLKIQLEKEGFKITFAFILICSL